MAPRRRTKKKVACANNANPQEDLDVSVDSVRPFTFLDIEAGCAGVASDGGDVMSDAEHIEEGPAAVTPKKASQVGIGVSQCTPLSLNLASRNLAPDRAIDSLDFSIGNNPSRPASAASSAFASDPSARPPCPPARQPKWKLPAHEVLPVGLWLSGPAGCGKSQFVTDVLPTISSYFGADPSKILGVKSSTGGFYDRIKESTRVFVFDDFAPDARATGEFLRLVSKTLSRDLNIKFGSVTCPFLSVVIVINNLTPSQFITESNQIQIARKHGVTPPEAFVRRFTCYHLGEEEIAKLRILHGGDLQVKKAFSTCFSEVVIKFIVRALRGDLPEQKQSREATTEIVELANKVLDEME